MQAFVYPVTVRTLSVVAAILVATSATAAGRVNASPPPPNPSDQQISTAQREQTAARAAVARTSGQLARVEANLQMLDVQTEAAADAQLQAEVALTKATDAAKSAAASLAAAKTNVTSASAAIETLARNVYIQGNYALTDLTLLEATGPADLIDRSNMLQTVSAIQDKTLTDLQIAKVALSNAESTARLAVQTRTAAKAKAVSTLEALQTKLADAKAAAAVLTSKRAALTTTLAKAKRRLASLAGQRAAYDAFVRAAAAKKAAAQAAAAAKAAAAAAAAQKATGDGSQGGGGASPNPPPSSAGTINGGGWALPVGGILTSCFCSRWGTFHPALDIAAPMLTPVYAAGPGTVMRAGFANGFGQAIYLQHDDGSVTVYGHIETIYVTAGQRVTGGQQIAGVGNRGFSTGPHLHFEVTAGMYGTKVDPVAWLAARGVSM